jgi:hypothetical protein
MGPSGSVATAGGGGGVIEGPTGTDNIGVWEGDADVGGEKTAHLGPKLASADLLLVPPHENGSREPYLDTAIKRGKSNKISATSISSPPKSS